MSDPILTAIARQKLACTLHALRTDRQEAGKWSDDLHGAAFEAKRVELEGRWK